MSSQALSPPLTMLPPIQLSFGSSCSSEPARSHSRDGSVAVEAARSPCELTMVMDEDNSVSGVLVMDDGRDVIVNDDGESGKAAAAGRLGIDDEHFDDTDNVLLESQSKRGQRITFVGLDEDNRPTAMFEAIDRKPLWEVPFDECEEVVDQRPQMSSERNARALPVAVDERFVEVSEKDEGESPLQRQRSARQHLLHMHSAEVHKVFQSHWEEQRGAQHRFRSILPDIDIMKNESLSSQEAELQFRRYFRLVNVSNYAKSHVDDVLIPITLACEEENKGLARHALAPSAQGPNQLALKKHQVEGIRFMWRCLLEGPPLSRVPAIGCILAHSMGLGKTCQVIVFLHLFVRALRQQPLGRPARIVIVAPKSVLSSWETEFSKWCPFFAAEDRITAVVMDDRMGKQERMSHFDDMFRDARCDDGNLSASARVILIGYEALVGIEKEFTRREVAAEMARGGGTQRSFAGRKAFDVDNPVDLVVCDEGHRLKSSDLDIARALGKLHALRRLILTGTPMQNHLLEYWAMSDFALPKFFDRKSFLTFFVKPIQRSADMNASAAEVAAAKKKTFILVQEFSNFTQRVDIEPLREELPPLHEFVVTVPLAPLQHSLYMRFLEIIRKEQGSRFNVLQAFSYATKICAHPQLLYDASETQLESGPYAPLLQAPAQYKFDPSDGLKLSLAVQIIRSAMRRGEKTLVFSLSTKMLDLFEMMLRKSDFDERNNGAAGVNGVGAKRQRDKDEPVAAERIRFLRIDGSSSGQEREQRIRDFQADAARYHCFLLSTKAGGVGITVTAATRVILLDCSFNPADDRQAIGRAYRYGQTKPVFVYRLVCRNTIEHRIFDQKVSKEWIFETCVNDKNIKRDALTGCKLHQIFLMRDARPLTVLEQAQVQLPQPTQDLTNKLCTDDPVLGEARRFVLTAAPHDTYLEMDRVERYGAEEEDSYQKYKVKGGLQPSEAPSAEATVRLNEHAKQQWEQVRHQTKTLSGIIDGIIRDRANANPRVCEILTRMGVIHSNVRGALPTTLGSAFVPIVLEDEDDEEDVVVVERRVGPLVRPTPPSLVRPTPPSLVVNPQTYGQFQNSLVGMSKSNAVEID